MTVTVAGLMSMVDSLARAQKQLEQEEKARQEAAKKAAWEDAVAQVRDVLGFPVDAELDGNGPMVRDGRERVWISWRPWLKNKQVYVQVQITRVGKEWEPWCAEQNKPYLLDYYNETSYHEKLIDALVTARKRMSII